jgi:hypothetical protein
VVELTLLTVPDCPNAPVLEERLAQALAGRSGVSVVRRVVDDDADAVRFGMHGSPTLLVDGVDPFAEPGVPASVSCRIYREEDGRLQGAPSVAAVRQVLEAAEAGVRPEISVAGSWSDALVRAGRGRVAPVEGGLRAVHQAVLGSFAQSGRAPSVAALAEAAAPFGADVEQVLARLHAADYLRLGDGGDIRAAYPFSAVPTPHVVQIGAGPRVFSMCAIDALGIAAMLRTDTAITSADPATGESITVTVPGDGGKADWDPATAVVFAGQRRDCGSCPEPAAGSETEPVAADVCCGYVNFFTSRKSAKAWAATHPEVTGKILKQTGSVRLGRDIFGPLLNTG